VLNRQDGRIAPGSVYQCFHGDRVVTQTILDWQPFERMLSEDLVMGKTTVLVELSLVPTNTGVRLVQVFSKARGPLPIRTVANMVLKSKAREAGRDIETFLARVAADHVAGGVGPATQIDAGEISSAVAASLSGGQSDQEMP
jgi:hypothetical protein